MVMGFVGGGGASAIASLLRSLPQSFLVLYLYCLTFTQFMGSILLLVNKFLYVEINPGLQLPLPNVCKIHCSNVQGFPVREPW